MTSTEHRESGERAVPSLASAPARIRRAATTLTGPVDARRTRVEGLVFLRRGGER